MFRIRVTVAIILALVLFRTAPVYGQANSNYPFQVAPAEALVILGDLPDSAKINLSTDEAQMFADVAAGKFKNWSLAEAALLASGVKDAQERKKYLANIDALTQAAAEEVGQAPPFEKGEKLLKFLHAKMLKKYSAKQTNVSVILDNGQFNCVSSAILYNIVAQRLGLDARGVVVKDHMFSRLYDGDKVALVETTNKLGFNPAKPKNYTQPREVAGPAMLIPIYNNHATEMARAKRLPEALQAALSILALDRENKDAGKNARAALLNIGIQLGKEGKYQEALQVVNASLRLAPTDRGFLQNQKYFQAKLTEVGR